RRRACRSAGARGRGNPARLHDRRGGRGPGRVPGEARPRLDPLPLVLLTGAASPGEATPGTPRWPTATVTSPGRAACLAVRTVGVVREISGGARQWVETNPEVYRALARRHATGVRPVTGTGP